MKEETLRDRIWKYCPNLYQGRYQPLSQNLMSFGFECGEGWDQPLLKLSCKLEAINETYKKYGIQIIADQVKEKYGELRYYYHIETKLPWYKCLVNYFFKKLNCWFHIGKPFYIGDTKFKSPLIRLDCSDKQTMLIYAIDHYVQYSIKEAEEECYNTCEVCGRQIGTKWSPRIQTEGWISYICENCAKKRKERE